MCVYLNGKVILWTSEADESQIGVMGGNLSFPMNLNLFGSNNRSDMNNASEVFVRYSFFEQFLG